MKSVQKKIEEQRGYGHQGFTINLNLTDEYLIANEVLGLQQAKSILGDWLTFGEMPDKQDMLAMMSNIERVIIFLNKMTTIDLSESINLLFNDDAEESSGVKTDAE